MLRNIYLAGVCCLVACGNWCVVLSMDKLVLELNRRRILLPHFNMALVPYHDPQFTMLDARLARYASTPNVIFTGDSRVQNAFNPEILAAGMGVDVQTFFTFGTGSQAISFAREVFIPHLLHKKMMPDTVVFGITPDWAINRDELRAKTI